MKALVTGGAGFIGSHVSEGLLAQGWEVTVLDDLSNGFSANVPSGARLVRGAASDMDVLDETMAGCNAIFHLAAVSSVQDSLARPVAVHDINLTTTLVLLEAAVRHQVKRFVFSSSAAVYGDTGGLPAREDMKPDPLSHYAVQKLASEYYCGVYHRLRGLEAVCLRYFNVFGPRQRADSPYSGVISRFAEAARRGEAPIIFGDGGQTRDFCHVYDVAKANIAAATRPGEKVAGRVFNVGSGASISVHDLAETIGHMVPGARPPVSGPARSGEIRHSQADIHLAAECLGYIPSVDFTPALRRLLEAG
jgi:nucleoside-diphosphate-sugar epimerase